MTQQTMNEFERDLSDDLEGSTTRGEHLDELLQQVRQHSVRFLSDVARTPRSLRIQAGKVTFDVEWADHDQSTVPVDPASASTQAVTAAPESAPSGEYLSAPTVGVYYEAREPGAAPFVSVGDTVEVGQQVAIVEAMKLMIPVQADKSGRITEVLKSNGDAVEYDEPLFSLVTAEHS